MPKQVVLYGAYDRYNYGDNLMPIVLEFFLRNKCSEKIKNIKILFSSIKKSNLSRYECKLTTPIKSLLSIDEGSTVIVVGGEVLGADVGTLYSHVQSSLFYTKILKIIRRFQPELLNVIASIFYPSVWKYPYVPRQENFNNEVNIIYNTVGGIPDNSQRQYIKNSKYISVRDKRTYDELSSFCDDVELVPDSVLAISGLVDNSFLESHVRRSIINYCSNNQFIIVQACPYKVQFSSAELSQVLKSIKDDGIDVVLLPIGYASGHDDVIFLQEVNFHAQGVLNLQYELNIWEIMYFISKSKVFFGTSLHGVITAMSFGVPHFNINKNIEKLTSFIQTWSVEPFCSPLEIGDIEDITCRMINYDRMPLVEHINKLQKIIFSSLDKISSLL